MVVADSRSWDYQRRSNELPEILFGAHIRMANMWNTVAWIACALALTGCAQSPRAAYVELRVLAENPAAYRGQQVRTCGWARNAFEDQSISISRTPRPSDGPPYSGLAVAWKPTSPATDQESVWRCVEGRVSGDCGPAGEFAEGCHGNVSPYPWVIIEAPCGDTSEPRCRLALHQSDERQ